MQAMSSSIAKEEGFRKVACKARNMPPDHDEESAYFMIPPNAPHGMLLGCSHPACGGRTKRFRYCAVCQVPVSKRNFSSRHKHNVAMGTVLSSVARSAIVPTIIESNESDAILSTSRASANSGQVDNLLRKQVENDEQAATATRPRKRGMQAADGSQRNDYGDAMEESQEMKVLNSQELRWLDLLHNRPNLMDSGEAKKWMESVVETANCSRTNDAKAKDRKDAVMMDNSGEDKKPALLPAQRRSFLQRNESSVLEEGSPPDRRVRRGKEDDNENDSDNSEENEDIDDSDDSAEIQRRVRPSLAYDSMRSDGMSTIALSENGRDISVTMEEIYGFDVEDVFGD